MQQLGQQALPVGWFWFALSFHVCGFQHGHNALHSATATGLLECVTLTPYLKLTYFS